MGAIAAIIGLVVGLVVGFIIGWLIRDMRERPLRAPGERFGMGVPGEWHRRQGGDGLDS